MRDLNQQYPATSQEQALLSSINDQATATMALSEQVIDARNADQFEQADDRNTFGWVGAWRRDELYEDE